MTTVVVPQLEAVQRVQQPAHLRVHERDAGVVGALEIQPVLVGERVEGGLESAAPHGQRRHRGDVRRVAIELQRAGRIEIEVLLRHEERIVRTMKARADEPRLAGGRLLLDGRDGVERVLSIGLVVVGAFHRADGAPLELAAGEIAHLAFAAGGRGLERLGFVPRFAQVHPAFGSVRRRGGRSCRRTPHTSRVGAAVAAW